MDDLFSILRAVNQSPAANQRELAAVLNISVGKVNSLLRSAEEEEYLLPSREGKRTRFALTDRGRRLLEGALLDRQQMKLSFPEEASPVRTAVILAAGRRRHSTSQPLCCPWVRGPSWIAPSKSWKTAESSVFTSLAVSSLSSSAGIFPVARM